MKMIPKIPGDNRNSPQTNKHLQPLQLILGQNELHLQIRLTITCAQEPRMPAMKALIRYIGTSKIQRNNKAHNIYLNGFPPVRLKFLIKHDCSTGFQNSRTFSKHPIIRKFKWSTNRYNKVNRVGLHWQLTCKNRRTNWTINIAYKNDWTELKT